MNTDRHRYSESVSICVHLWLKLRRCILVLFVFSGTTAVATAPHLASILPAGGQRGTELQLSLGGERLNDTEEIICHGPGLEVKRLDLITNNQVKATVRISPDCALGEHH